MSFQGQSCLVWCLGWLRAACVHCSLGRVRDARGHHQVPTLSPLTSWIRGKHEKMGVCLSVLVSLLPEPQASNLRLKLYIFT